MRSESDTCQFYEDFCDELQDIQIYAEDNYENCYGDDVSHWNNKYDTIFGRVCKQRVEVTSAEIKDLRKDTLTILTRPCISIHYPSYFEYRGKKYKIIDSQTIDDDEGEPYYDELFTEEIINGR